MTAGMSAGMSSRFWARSLLLLLISACGSIVREAKPPASTTLDLSRPASSSLTWTLPACRTTADCPVLDRDKQPRCVRGACLAFPAPPAAASPTPTMHARAGS
jgi:hypothetical protein